MSQRNKCEPLCFLVHTTTLWAVALSLGSPKVFFFFFSPPPQRQVAALAPVHQCAAPHWHTHSHNCDTYQPPLCFCLCYRKQTRATMFVLRIRGEYACILMWYRVIFFLRTACAFSVRTQTIPGVPLYLPFFSFPVINRLIPAIYLFIYLFKQCSASWYVTS